MSFLTLLNVTSLECMTKINFSFYYDDRKLGPTIIHHAT